ncbi:MAG: type II toxin-antitoxin system HicA family toxin [Syntrophomonadaceae bacterium]|nr:type II toxin-antitoxin system HicA family toxin [Syntrophomonadaceae bacterium]
MPSWRDLKRFCERDGWELYKKTDHWYYQKLMPDGVLKRTKVSFGTGEISKHRWREILTKQLQVSEEYFNKKL